MSAVNSEVLKSASDPNIPFFTRPENFTIAQLRRDSLPEFGKLIKALKVINNDSLANVTVRLQSPSAPLQTIPPSSDQTFIGWTSYIEINPDPASGSGQIEIDLVDLSDAVDPVKQKKFNLGSVGGL